MKYTGIALSGKQRSGKDSTAQELAKLDPRFVRQGFADALKKMAQKETGIDYFIEENKIKHRGFLIKLGQAYRTFDENYWVKKLLSSTRPGIVPVITDCRFKNEAKALKAAGYLLIRLQPNIEVIEQRGGKILQDPSETDLDDYDGFDGVIDTGLNSPAATALKIAGAFGELPKEQLYGQSFRPGDKVKIIGGLYTPKHLPGVVLEVLQNAHRVARAQVDPVIVIRLDEAFGGKLQYTMRPNQVELLA